MPTHVLGLSCFYHDSAAALLRDGLNPYQIARELGISKSKAYRLREQAVSSARV